MAAPQPGEACLSDPAADPTPPRVGGGPRPVTEGDALAAALTPMVRRARRTGDIAGVVLDIARAVDLVITEHAAPSNDPLADLRRALHRAERAGAISRAEHTAFAMVPVGQGDDVAREAVAALATVGLDADEHGIDRSGS